MTEQFGYWLIIGTAPDSGKILCRCICGTDKLVNIKNLYSGKTKSCGCQGRPNYKKFKKERRAWSLMRHRCSCPKSADYSRYGARGIVVCERWHSFDNFLEDMGQMPFLNATIERIEVDSNYEPGNCKWASMKEQAQNKRTTRWVKMEGKKLCLSEAARQYGIKNSTLRERLNRGWTVEEALSEPVS